MDCSPSQDKSEEKHGTKSFPQCLGMGHINLEAATIRALPKTCPPHAHGLAVGDGLPSASSGRPCHLGGYRSPPLRVLTILNKILPRDSTSGFYHRQTEEKSRAGPARALKQARVFVASTAFW